MSASPRADQQRGCRILCSAVPAPGRKYFALLTAERLGHSANFVTFFSFFNKKGTQ